MKMLFKQGNSTLAEENISRTIIFYANQTLRTIALCYRDFESWPPKGLHRDDAGEVPFEDLAQDLILISITGIEDPLRSRDSHGTTVFDKDEGSLRKKKVKRRRSYAKDDEKNAKSTHDLELEQDRDTDPRPFAFRPYQLAHMLDPKSYNTLGRCGGTEGILRGLGTDASQRLSETALSQDSGPFAHHSAMEPISHNDGGGGKGAGEGASHGHEPIQEKYLPRDTLDAELAKNATVDDRRCIYG